MSGAPESANAFSLILIEAGLIAIAVMASLLCPRLGTEKFARFERTWNRLARRKRLAAASVGVAMIVLRLALLPWCPVPLPVLNSDFSFLLAAETFAHGRLTNRTPVMWTHFESIHITVQPTYMSMYFPGQALLMAAGKLIFGHPWAGILMASGLMCAAICWMLQAWLPPGWALLGGVIAILRIGLFSYWVNTYTGAATIAALGGALLLGALPRLKKTARFRYGLLMASGVALLLVSRPYEGALLCIPVFIALGHWLFAARNRLLFPLLMRRALLPVILLLAVLAWMGYYNRRVFGSARVLPYTVARAQYAVVPYYIWQPAHPLPLYRHLEMRRFYTESEMADFAQLQSVSGYIPRTMEKVGRGILFFAGPALFLPLFMCWRVFRDRRLRFLAYCMLFAAVGVAISVFLLPHYLAPFTSAVYALGLQAMRHLRVWKPEGGPVGLALARFAVVVCFVMAGLRLAAEPLRLLPREWPAGPWLCTWVGPGHFGIARAEVARDLESLPGKHLVFVRYGLAHDPEDEWAYNAADIDAARIIWARAMDAASDKQLMEYYKDRDVWLVRPDRRQGILTPYSASEKLSDGQ